MKTALVTGVSSGIGRATAVRLAESGYRTFGTVRSDAAPPRNVELLRLDVRDAEAAQSAVAEVLDRAGRIDVLVNNAGTALVGAAEETSIGEAREVFETNVFALMRMTQAVIPAMREQGGGRIVNISSLLGFLPAPFMSVYAASKHAVEGYSESLDHEVRGFGIRVIAVEPGFTRTNLGRSSHVLAAALPAYGADRQRVLQKVAKNIEQGADPEAVAEVVLRAIGARAPRPRYQVGRSGTILRLLRAVAPDVVIDRGIRKEFGLV